MGPTGTLKSCRVRGDSANDLRELVLLNSGDSVLIFDLAITLSRGTSGLIKILNLQQDIIPALWSGKQANPASEAARQHPLFLQSFLSAQAAEQSVAPDTAGIFSSPTPSNVHIQSLQLHDASYEDVVREDGSEALVRQMVCLTLTNGQAWFKGINLNAAILECPRVRTYFEASNAANLKEITLLKVLPRENACVYVLNETVLVRHDLDDVKNSTLRVFDRPIKALLFVEDYVWVAC